MYVFKFIAKTPARSVRSIARQNHCENLVWCYNFKSSIYIDKLLSVKRSTEPRLLMV